MPIVKLQKRKSVKYPELCPVCEERGKLKRYPIGSAFEKTKTEKYIPIHKCCWRSINNKVLVFSSIIFISLIGLIIAIPGLSRLEMYAFAILISLLASKYYPLPVDIIFSEKYIQFDFSSEKYAEEFKKVNEKILFHM